jgi:hypothetical protein
VVEGELQAEEKLAELERRLSELDRAMTLAERILALPDQSAEQIAAVERSLHTLKAAFAELVRESLELMRTGQPPNR